MHHLAQYSVVIRKLGLGVGSLVQSSLAVAGHPFFCSVMVLITHHSPVIHLVDSLVA